MLAEMPRVENSGVVPPGNSGGPICVKGMGKSCRAALIGARELCRPSPVVRARIEHSGDQGHSHEIRQACRLHFHHQIRSVVLDRSSADSEIVSNLLVGASRHETLEHIALALRQSRKAALDVAALRLTLLVAISPIECRPYRGE